MTTETPEENRRTAAIVRYQNALTLVAKQRAHVTARCGQMSSTSADGFDAQLSLIETSIRNYRAYVSAVYDLLKLPEGKSS